MNVYGGGSATRSLLGRFLPANGLVYGLVALVAVPGTLRGQEGVLAEAAQAIEWAAEAETVAITFNRAVLRDLGVEIQALHTTAPAIRQEPGSLGFAARGGQSLSFTAPGGAYQSLTGGLAHFDGGFDLALPGGAVASLRGFALRALHGDRPFELLDAGGTSIFYLDFAHALVQPAQERLEMRNMDLRLSPSTAARLGRPGLTGLAVAQVDFLARAPVPAGIVLGDGGCTVTGGDVDVALTGLDDVSQVAREAGVRVALSLSAVVANVGDASVDWFRAISPDGTVGPHPYLAMNFYRLRDGRLEQIGRSDVKHAFFTINSGCACSGGHVFYPGCSDVYGTSSNSNRQHFGPREELTAEAGTWTSLGSHFDDVPVDDFRSHGGNASHDDFEHRLVVAEGNLQDGSDRYFAEAWYLAEGDVNIFNGMGYREVQPKLQGSLWDFLFLNPLRSGTVMDAWPAAEGAGAAGTDTLFPVGGPGEARLSARVTPAAGGGFRYELALMNFDISAGFDEISIPLPEDVTVSAVTFFDGDEDPVNDWAASVGAFEVRWRAPAGTKQGWGSLYSFGFTAPSAPQPTTAEIAVPAASQFLVETLAPLAAGLFADGFESSGTGAWTHTISE